MRVAVIIILIICRGYSLAQLSSSGSLQFNTRAEIRDLMPQWTLSGSFTLKFKKWNLPFSGSYSNRIFSYTHPFNKLCLRPEFRNFKLAAGYCNLSWSPLYFSGETFLGGGIEYEPVKWKFAGFYGQFRKPGLEPASATDRRGSGFQLLHKQKKWGLGIDALYFYDKIPGYLFTENYFGGIHTRLFLTKNIQWKSEHGISFFPGTDIRLKHQLSLRGKTHRIPWSLEYMQSGAGFRTLGMSAVSNDDIQVRGLISPLLGKRLRSTIQYREDIKGVSSARWSRQHRRVVNTALQYKAASGFAWKANGMYSFSSSKVSDPEQVITPRNPWNATLQSGLQWPVKKLKKNLGFDLSDLRSGIGDSIIFQEQRVGMSLDPFIRIFAARRSSGAVDQYTTGLSSNLKGTLFHSRLSWNTGIQFNLFPDANRSLQWQARLDLRYVSKNKKIKMELNFSANPKMNIQLNGGWSW